MTAVLAVVVSSVLLLWLLLVLVVVVAVVVVVVVVVVGRSMFSFRGVAVRTAWQHAGHRPRELASVQPVLQ